MPNWCSNKIAFYSDENSFILLEAFHSDLQKYLDYKDPKTGENSDWVGNWLESNKVDTESVHCRGFLQSCELYDTFVRVDMETAWCPTTEIWDIIAEKYSLSYVYVSEESGNEVYVNSDAENRFFSERYILNYFGLNYLELDSDTLAKHGEHLKNLSGVDRYYSGFDEVMCDFVEFGFKASDIDELNQCLEKFNLQVYEFALE